MASEIFQRDDLSVYVLAGVPKSFKATLAEVVREATDDSGDLKMVNGEMADWFLAKLRENGRRRHERTPASAALWRAYRALCAARYHLKDEAVEEEVREIRTRIEELWTLASPLHPEDEPVEAADSLESSVAV